MCLLAGGCTSEKESPTPVLSGAAVTDGATLAPDVAPAIVEQAPLKKERAFEDGMGFAYSGTVTLSGEYVLENHDGAESLCFAPDAESAKKLPDTESNGAFCFSNEGEARKLLKVKPINWEKLPKDMCQAIAAATVTVTDYEDWVSDGDGMDQARLKSVQATASASKLSKCDWVPIDEDVDSKQASPEPKESTAETSEGGSWPTELGAYRTSSSAGIPPFPERLEGYKPSGGPESGVMRVFKGQEWKSLPNVEAAHNGCSHSIWMVRWRSANTITVLTTSEGRDAGESTHGYMLGSRCNQPNFKFGATDGSSTLVDVFYEIQHWNAAP